MPNELELPLFPVREMPARQTGPYLLADVVPSDFQKEMEDDEHALSRRLMRSDLWSHYVWNGTTLTAPLMALWAAESNGLYTKHVPIAVIANDVNQNLLKRGRKPITDNSVFSNLSKAAKYLQAAFHIVIQPNREDMNVSVLDSGKTVDSLKRWFGQINSRVKKIETLTKHAEVSDFKTLEALAGSSPTIESFKQISASLKSIGATNE